MNMKGLKVPKYEIFHLFDFNDFNGIKSLQLGDLRAEIKNFFKCWPDTYHFIFASVCAVYASNGANCYRRRRMRQQIASVCGACGSILLAYTAHAVAKSCKTGFLQAYAAHAVANCQRMRQQLASVDSPYACKLLAYAPHTVAICQRRQRMRQLEQKGILYAVYTLLAQTAHTVAICYRRRRMRQLKQNGQYLTHLYKLKKIYFSPQVPYLYRQRMRQHIASVCCAYGSKLLAQTAHAVAKSCKNEFLLAYAAHKVTNSQRMRRHAVALCQRMRQQLASV